MRKYFLVKNNQELKLGDVIKMTKPVDTSYGKGETTVKIKVDLTTLNQLVEDGYVRVEDYSKEEFEKITPYIGRFSHKHSISFSEACVVLAGLCKISPRAHFQLVLETIAEMKNKGKKPVKKVWYLNPFADYKPVIVDYNPAIISFYSEKDALDAYNVLRPFIEELVNGKLDGK